VTKLLRTLVRAARVVAALARGRSGKWPRVERLVFERDGHRCRACGRSDCKLIGHHVCPYHVDRKKELDPNNVITMCQPAGGGDHLGLGHTTRDGKRGWKYWNPDVVADAAAKLAKIDPRVRRVWEATIDSIRRGPPGRLERLGNWFWRTVRRWER
jgi:hypothetical protein